MDVVEHLVDGDEHPPTGDFYNRAIVARADRNHRGVEIYLSGYPVDKVLFAHVFGRLRKCWEVSVAMVEAAVLAVNGGFAVAPAGEKNSTALSIYCGLKRTYNASCL
jgi:hypothetical protein